MYKLFRLSLVQRFYQSIREEGLRSAIRKARTYIGMRLRGAAPSSLGNTPGVPPVPQGEHMYLSHIWRALAQDDAFHVMTAPALLQGRRKIALIGDLNLPQCRKYRVEQLAEFWRGQGVDVGYSHYQDVPRCTAILQDATHLMEYRLQTMPVNAMYRYEARRLRLPVLYDLDDPLFSVSAYETYENMKALDPAFKMHFLGEAPKYLDMMNGADILTVSTPGLVEHTRLYTPRPVYMRRNFADSLTLEDGRAAIAAADRGKDGLFRIALASGSQGHEADLEIILDQLIDVLDANPDHRLMILGHFDLKFLPGGLRAQVELHPFTTYGRYLEALASADCAIMPLVDDTFNRCKSAVRVLDAASVGVASVVGTVGDMQNVVLDGDTGLVVQDTSAWGDALTQLGRDRAATQAMGLAARRDLETRWAGNAQDHIIAPQVMEWVKG